MLLTNWLNCLTNHRRPQRSGRGRRQAKPASAALRVERLEDRTLLTTNAVVEFVNGIVQVTGNDDPVSADADDHLEIDVRFDNATPTNDGAGFYLHVLATDGGAGGTVTAVGDFVNQIDTDEVTVFIGAKLDPDPPANNPNKILKEKTRGVRVEGLNGDDVIDADPGGSGTNWMKVTLLGGDGDDVLTGSAAKNRLLGEDGDDWLVGGISNDRLMGGPGDDWLTGREGDDTLVGGAGADTLDGGSFFTSLFDDGDDSLLGGGGNDLLFPGTSNVDTNSNTVNGGAGRDMLVAVDFNPVIDLDPGPGEDLRVVPITIIRGSNPGIPDELHIPGNDSATSMVGPDVAPTHTFFEEVETALVFGGDSPNDINIEHFDEIGATTVLGFGGNDTITTGAGADSLLGGEVTTSSTPAVATTP